MTIVEAEYNTLGALKLSKEKSLLFTSKSKELHYLDYDTYYKKHVFRDMFTHEISNFDVSEYLDSVWGIYNFQKQIKMLRPKIVRNRDTNEVYLNIFFYKTKDEFLTAHGNCDVINDEWEEIEVKQ